MIRNFYVSLIGFTVAWITAAAFACTVVVPMASAATSCQEDQPCWNWTTMGNHKRGVVLTNGKRAVVSPHTFAHKWLDGEIDWQRTPHLRGDWHARSFGC